jgi:hypothetical protein
MVVAAALGGSAAGAAELRAASAASPANDAVILSFGLQIERLQAAFYAQALHDGKLNGEARQLATVVGAHEQAHARFLAGALGTKAGKSPSFRFGTATTDQGRFIATAVLLEETGLAVYNGQAVNLTPHALAAAARLVSVEARHAAWARALAGKDPAPLAVDVPISVSQAQSVFQHFIA